MSKNRYVRLFDSIKADENAIKKAVDSIYEREATEVVEFKKSRSVNPKFVSTVAAALVFVILLGLFVFPITPKSVNSLVISAGATEINTLNSVEIGELKGDNNALRICFNDADEVNYLAQCKVVKFPVVCTGNNIDKITYKVNGNGYFALSSDADGVSNMVYVEEKPKSFDEAERYPYDLADTEEYTEKVLSYTVDYDAQSTALAKLCLYTVDDNDEYCKLYNENIYFEKEDNTYIHGKDYDFEDMYYNIFIEESYSVDITVTYSDGTKETKTLDLGLKKFNKLYESGEDGEYTALNVNAKLSE